MDSCVIKERQGIWTSCLTLAVFAAAVVYLLRFAGVAAMIAVAVCAVFVATACLYEGYKTITITEESICVKTIFRTTKVSWTQVDKVSILWLKLGQAPGWYISVTWPLEENRKTWVQRWLWWMKLEDKNGFLFPYSDKLHNAIMRYRGWLDYDGRENNE